MATKVNMLKLLQEMRGLSDFTSRRPPSRHPGLVVMASRAMNQKTPANRKRVITVVMQDMPDIPAAVKIVQKTTQPER